MEREKTNSITHLVKIVATEVFEKKFEEMTECFNNVSVEEVAEKFFENIKSSLEEVGQKWQRSEDQLLDNEIRIAIATIAKNHGRTYGAIRSRIKQKGLFL